MKLSGSQAAYEESIRAARSIQLAPLLLSLLVDIGEHLLQHHQPADGLTALSVALYHPVGDQEIKDRVERTLAVREVSLSREQATEAIRLNDEVSLSDSVDRAWTRLASTAHGK